MAIALSTVIRDISRRNKTLIVNATLSGNYTPGGITVDWTTVLNPKLLSGGRPAANPTYVEVLNAPAGYTGELIAGSTMKNWLFKVFIGGAELGAAAFPAAIAADPFVFQISGPLGNF